MAGRGARGRGRGAASGAGPELKGAAGGNVTPRRPAPSPHPPPPPSGSFVCWRGLRGGGGGGAGAPSAGAPSSARRGPASGRFRLDPRGRRPRRPRSPFGLQRQLTGLEPAVGIPSPAGARQGLRLPPRGLRRPGLASLAGFRAPGALTHLLALRPSNHCPPAPAGARSRDTLERRPSAPGVLGSWGLPSPAQWMGNRRSPSRPYPLRRGPGARHLSGFGGTLWASAHKARGLVAHTGWSLFFWGGLATGQGTRGLSREWPWPCSA